MLDGRAIMLPIFEGLCSERIGRTRDFLQDVRKQYLSHMYST